MFCHTWLNLISLQQATTAVSFVPLLLSCLPLSVNSFIWNLPTRSTSIGAHTSFVFLMSLWRADWQELHVYLASLATELKFSTISEMIALQTNFYNWIQPAFTWFTDEFTWPVFRTSIPRFNEKVPVTAGWRDNVPKQVYVHILPLINYVLLHILLLGTSGQAAWMCRFRRKDHFIHSSS